MSLTPVKCTYCGGELQVVNIYQPVICPYCHSTFVIQPDINNYNTINNINANVVNITYNVTQQVSSVQEAPKTKQSNSQQSSYSNKSNSLTYRTQSDIYNPTYKPSPSKSVAKEYVKGHPEQFKKDTSNRWSFWGFIRSLWLGAFHIWDDNHNKKQNIYNVIGYLIIVTSITLIIFLSPVVTIYAIVADECDNLLKEEGMLFPIVSIVGFILLVIYIYKRITKK